MLKKVFLITIMASSVFAQEDLSIEIDISKQRLFLLENSVITSSYPVSYTHLTLPTNREV